MKYDGITSFQVKRYRSLMDVTIPMNSTSPIVICGENNIGKTNFLRAMNVFFNYSKNNLCFDPKIDIPSHIFHGSQGAGSKSEFIAKFQSGTGIQTIKLTIKNDGNPSYEIDGTSVDDSKAEEIISQYCYFLIESHNINLPLLIPTLLEKDGLLSLDSKRKKQSQPLEALKKFILLSESAISDIEKELNQCFEKFIDFEGILQGKKLKISFAEFDRLRDVVKTMTSITLHDGNLHGIASKGSGAQRAIFLALMQYIAQNTKKKIIWGIDEPEAFLQPRLQKKVNEVFFEINKQKDQPVILTTHSQHFINLNDLSNTYLFEGVQNRRTYHRKPGKIFYEINTSPIKTANDAQKANLIKEHLGISNNDGWEVLPHNVLVEGESDKKYLETLFSLANIPAPNIIWSGGASKIAGYLQFYNIFAKDLGYKPSIKCLFDNDEEGRQQSSKLHPKSLKNLLVKVIDLPRLNQPQQQSRKDENWEIEDLLPPAKLIEAINSILRKEGYRAITQTQIKDRNKPAHLPKQILIYAEECCTANNPNMPSLKLFEEGRKMQICQKFCEMAIKDPKYQLPVEHVTFLAGLADK